ncbi:MAG: hypothetical protein JXQ87_16250 [Bacteroidia bacterium]
MKHLLTAFGLALIFSACLVQHPEYVKYEKVVDLYSGMSFDDLQDSIGIKPYYVKEDVKDAWKVYVYKYRTCELKRIPIIMRRNSGFEMEGDFVDLLVTVNQDNLVIKLETVETAADAEQNTTVIDFNSLMQGLATMITVTLPAFLVFLSNGN